jgi:hypothetical protein
VPEHDSGVQAGRRLPLQVRGAGAGAGAGGGGLCASHLGVQ